ncbi:transposase [Streptomyces sp. NPDC046712]|uniref:transposase n=1 Tax=Streptomyces sp. NPDC046712 TaxID=3154802 RepID=UPI0033C93DBA
MGRGDLTGAQWAVLESLLPTGQRGWPPKWTKPQLINGFRWRKRTGAPWRTVPKSIRVPRPGGGRPPVLGRTGYGRTRPTPRAPTVPSCKGVVSAPSRRRRTRPPNGASAARCDGWPPTIHHGGARVRGRPRGVLPAVGSSSRAVVPGLGGRVWGQPLGLPAGQVFALAPAVGHDESGVEVAAVCALQPPQAGTQPGGRGWPRRL